jgi:uncharacterized spore protein YtfJ
MTEQKKNNTAKDDKIDAATLKYLRETFKLSQETYNLIEVFYNTKILPVAEKKYLAHLVAIVEDIIDKDIKDKNKGKKNKNTTDKARDFSIIIEPGAPPGTKVATFFLDRGAIIRYNEKYGGKKRRICVANGIGHILFHSKIINADDVENYANLFAFLVIHGEDIFYKKNAEDLTYEKVKDIIDEIKDVYPISGVKQRSENWTNTFSNKEGKK